LLSYAESTDVIHFTVPDPRRYEIDKSIPNGVGQHGGIDLGSVWIDPKAPPEHRYRTQVNSPLKGTNRFHIYSSPDGYRWTFMAEPKTSDCHTQSIIFWDGSIQRYALYTRLWKRFGYKRPGWTGKTPEEKAEDARACYRMVRRLESDDLVHWDNETIVMRPDGMDLATYDTPDPQPPVDYYGAAVFRYPDNEGVYIMLAQTFWHWKSRPAGQEVRLDGQPAKYLAPALVDVRLAVSRDGKAFARVGGRKPFLRLGLSGSYSSQRIWAMPNPIEMGDEIWIYYAGKNENKDSFIDPAAGESRAGISRAVMRLDGLVSADADYAGGEIVTPLLRFTGSTLQLNVDAGGGGSVRVESELIALQRDGVRHLQVVAALVRLHAGKADGDTAACRFDRDSLLLHAVDVVGLVVRQGRQDAKVGGEPWLADHLAFQWLDEERRRRAGGGIYRQSKHVVLDRNGLGSPCRDPAR